MSAPAPDPINNPTLRKAVIAAAIVLVAAIAALLGVPWPTGDPGTPPTPTPSVSPSVTPTPTPSPTPQPLRPSWQTTGSPALTFSDEFNDTTVDAAKWETGWFGTGITNGVNSNNLNCYDSAQVTESAGYLNLTVAKRAASCNGGTREYVSGLVNTRKSFNQQYGSFEARVCLSDQDKNGQVDGFPAWWTNGPSNVSWPEHGEIDAVEGIGGRTKASLHYITSTATGTAYGSGSYSDVTPTTGPLGNKVGCHNFGFVWDATSVTFYYDGAKLYGHAFRGPHPQFLILNYALRSTEQIQVGSAVKVDWVRAWK